MAKKPHEEIGAGASRNHSPLRHSFARALRAFFRLRRSVVLPRKPPCCTGYVLYDVRMVVTVLQFNKLPII